MSFTNKACQNLREKSGLNEYIYTFDSYFSDTCSTEHNVEKMKDVVILIDEFCMAPNKWMTLIYRCWLKWQNEVYLFGDNEQCDPVDVQVYNYVNSLSVLQMVGNRVEELEYKGHRYCDKMYEVLKEFRKSSVLENIQKSDGVYRKNMCVI